MTSDQVDTGTEKCNRCGRDAIGKDRDGEWLCQEHASRKSFRRAYGAGE